MNPRLAKRPFEDEDDEDEDMDEKQEQYPNFEDEECVVGVLVAALGRPKSHTGAQGGPKLLRVALQEGQTKLRIFSCQNDSALIQFPGWFGEGSDVFTLAELCRMPVVDANIFWSKLFELSTRVKVPVDCLSSLSLCGVQLLPEQVSWIANGLAQNPVLTFLDVSGNGLGDEGIACIARGLKKNTRLRTLIVSNVQKDKQTVIGRGWVTLFQENPKYLVNLDISRNVLEGEMVLNALGRWLSTNPSLKELDLSSTGTDYRVLSLMSESLQNNTSLTCLHLDYCDVEVFWRIATNFLVLKEVSFAGTTLNRHVMHDWLRPNSPLTTLKLHACKLTSDVLDALERNESIKELYLISTAKGLDVGRLVHVLGKKGNTLTHISLCGNRFLVGEGIRSFLDGLRSNHCLQYLSLSHIGLDDNIARRFSQEGLLLETLQRLDLSCSRLGNQGAKWIFEWAQRSKVLSFLDLGFCEIGTEGAAFAAAALTRNRSIRTLYLGQNEIGDEGARVIGCALETNSTLSCLALGSVNMTSVGARYLAASVCSNKTLTVLNVCDNNVDLDGGTAFLEMLKVNLSILQLYYDNGNSPLLNTLLERNFALRIVVKRSIMCFLACRRFRKGDFVLGILHTNVFKEIAELIWSTRTSREWLPLLKMSGL
jgi:Ran GTPase-activating protein (RanGAP) involved in mRNA processing and transport